MNTQEMMDMALRFVGLSKPTADCAVIVPGENIKRVLAGIDMNTPELLVAKLMGYDCVVGHHPRNIDLVGMNELFRSQMYDMQRAGVPINEAQKLIELTAKPMEESDHGFNFNRNASAAEVLNMPFMCIHSPADFVVERELQAMIDERFGDKPLTRLSELMTLFDEIPEYGQAVYGPKIAVGSPDSYAGRILVIMSGVSDGGPEVAKAYFRAGVGTIIYMHCGEDMLKAIREQNMGNVIIAGHMASDSYGMNRIIEQWEKAGLEVTRMSGLLPGRAR